mmetsp:Transcript_6589/g.17861  ORF Transcript_6589/g.17861 Transcript_6589/m.17861 type:complete len:253 (+) Transcript_6589:438-1196(+)
MPPLTRRGREWRALGVGFGRERRAGSRHRGTRDLAPRARAPARARARLLERGRALPRALRGRPGTRDGVWQRLEWPPGSRGREVPLRARGGARPGRALRRRRLRRQGGRSARDRCIGREAGGRVSWRGTLHRGSERWRRCDVGLWVVRPTRARRHGDAPAARARARPASGHAPRDRGGRRQRPLAREVRRRERPRVGLWHLWPARRRGRSACGDAPSPRRGSRARRASGRRCVDRRPSADPAIKGTMSVTLT